MVKKKSSILSCLTLVFCLIISMPAVIWASESVASCLYGTSLFGSVSGEWQEPEGMAQLVSEANSISSVENELVGC